MSNAALVIRQARYENKAFWRNPAAAFFTFAFPLLFLVIFTTVLGDLGDNTTLFVPQILSFSVITACFTNIAMSISFSRDEGILKRIRGTPCPPWVYLTARVLHAIFVMLLLVVIVVAFGALAYGVELPTETMPAFALTLIVGSAAFCALGLAVTALVPNAEAAPAIVNALVFPLLFLSGTFFPIDNAPEWLQPMAGLFPVRHLLEATTEAFLPSPDNPSGLLGMSLLVMLAWAVAGLLFAIRFFRWEPRR